MMSWKKATAAAITLATLAYGGNAMAQSDPGTASYNAAVQNKKVIMVPMAMGFDLAQGWAYYIGKEVKGFGGTFETRDPNWSVEAGAQAIT